MDDKFVYVDPSCASNAPSRVIVYARKGCALRCVESHKVYGVPRDVAEAALSLCRSYNTGAVIDGTGMGWAVVEEFRRMGGDALPPEYTFRPKE